MTDFRMPNLLLVGAQKSGTSHVHHVLSQSPDIVGSEPKELNYFNQKNHLSAENQNRYKSHFPAGAQRYYLESTPHYFRLPIAAPDYQGPVTIDVAQAIAETLPADDLNLMLVLRNPVERALSATVHNMAKGRLPQKPLLESAIDEHGILARGYYYRILLHWKNMFGEQLKVFFYDELLSNPLQFYQSIAEWLGIDKAFLASIDLHQKTNSSESLAANSGLVKRPVATVELVEELIELFREDIEALFVECSVNYPNWLAVEKVAGHWV